MKVKTDAIFYELIKDIPKVLFELIGRPNTNLNAYQFTAQELKQQSFRLDGIFSTLAGFDVEPLYFVEFQTYKDEEFYERLFGEIFLYFRQYRPPNSQWYAIVIYGRRSHEVPPHPRYEFLMSQYVQRIYLNEIPTDDSLAVGIARLFVETPSQTTTKAQQLINQARSELSDARLREKVLAFIQTIVVYKFPNLALEEIEAMLDLSEFKNSRFYESLKQKTKLELVPKLLDKGMSIQEVADLLELDVEEVRKAARQ
jgi:predicted transposase/invertase (TIGR01784 family)